MEELKKQMENRRTEIGILQDYDFENDFKIQNIENTQNAHDKDINELSIEIDQLSYEVNVNITDVKNDLSNQISNMVIAPIGTIQGWSPIPEIGIENPVSLPKCWVTCDGSLINEGIWAGHHSPDLNNANRYGTRNLEMSICFSLKSQPSERVQSVHRPEMSQIKAEILRTNMKLNFHKDVGLQ